MDKKPPKEVEPIFSADEKRKIVRSFIDAYLRGTVKIVHFGEAGKKDNFESRKMFLAHIETVSDASLTGKATAEVIDLGVDSLFSFIVASRMGERIEGEFLQAPVGLDSRVEELERKFESEIKSLSKILSLILQWIKTYQPVLEEAAKDYADKLGRVEKLDKKDQ
jgi:hypothetical protein